MKIWFGGIRKGKAGRVEEKDASGKRESSSLFLFSFLSLLFEKLSLVSFGFLFSKLFLLFHVQIFEKRKQSENRDNFAITSEN